MSEQHDPLGHDAGDGEVRAQPLHGGRRQRRVLVQHAAEQQPVSEGEDQRLSVGESRHVDQIILRGALQQVVGHHARMESR